MAIFSWHTLTQAAYNTKKFDVIHYVEESGAFSLVYNNANALLGPSLDAAIDAGSRSEA